ncbi:phosphatidylglycerophosphatase and protein-tyrosine phosphatase 1-like isoform X2 [Glandiceps talaboti]
MPTKVAVRLLFFPTLFYDVVMTRMSSSRRWYDRIDSTVILGALPFRGMTKQLVDEENVHGVITMNEEYETKYWVNSRQEWADAGVEQLRLSTRDFTGSPTLDNVNKAINFITEIKDKNQSVYIHCKAGRTRSATIVACYLMKSSSSPKGVFVCTQVHVIPSWAEEDYFHTSLKKQPR